MFETPISEISIGFVGLGTMGMPMAMNAVDAGFNVTGFDIREEVLASFEAAGGDRAENLADLAADCAVVSVIVQDDEQVKDVVAGPNGIFEHGDKALVLIPALSTRRRHSDSPKRALQT